jgi:L-amino acid N-acyltransferase YncA
MTARSDEGPQRRPSAKSTTTADRVEPILIRPLTAAAWPEARWIYEAGIATGDATLEREAPDWAAWDLAHRPDCRLVARGAEGDDGSILGWAALSPTSSRTVYGGVAWESVYVAPEAQGRGVGTALLAALVAASEAAGVWTLQAGVLAENAASLALHERAGFRRVGVQRRLGRDAAERWRDVVLMERRSEIVGTD